MLKVKLLKLRKVILFWYLLGHLKSIFLNLTFSGRKKRSYIFKHILLQNYAYMFSSTYELLLTLSCQSSLSYRNQSIGMLCKSLDWFLYDRDFRHQRVKILVPVIQKKRCCCTTCVLVWVAHSSDCE